MQRKLLRRMGTGAVLAGVLALGLTLVATGCGGINPESFAGSQPAVVLEEYFSGETTAAGIFVDRFGALRRQFDVTMVGAWDEASQTLTLVEDFVYDDGETERRTWVIVKGAEGKYTGAFEESIGEARGEAFGRAFNWRYRMALPVEGGKTWNVTLNDWFFRMDDGTVYNEAVVRRWGIKLGRVLITFRKPNADE